MELQKFTKGFTGIYKRVQSDVQMGSNELINVIKGIKGRFKYWLYALLQDSDRRAFQWIS